MELWGEPATTQFILESEEKGENHATVMLSD